MSAATTSKAGMTSIFIGRALLPDPPTKLQPGTIPGSSRGRSERSERDRIALGGDGGDAVLVGRPCRAGDQVDGSPLQRDLVAGGPPAVLALDRGARREVRPQTHATGREERQADDDVVLRRVAMPAYRRAGWV